MNTKYYARRVIASLLALFLVFTVALCTPRGVDAVYDENETEMDYFTEPSTPEYDPDENETPEDVFTEPCDPDENELPPDIFPDPEEPDEDNELPEDTFPRPEQPGVNDPLIPVTPDIGLRPIHPFVPTKPTFPILPEIPLDPPVPGPPAVKNEMEDIPEDGTDILQSGRKGDLNGDGNVDIADVARLYSHIRGTNPLTDDSILTCAKVTENENIDIADVARLYAHVKGTIPL